MKIRSDPKARSTACGALLLALFVAMTPWAAELEAGETPVAQEPPPDVVVEVNGLSCPFCAYGIEKKFDERPEVASIVVALEGNEVRLWLKAGQELSDEEVRRTVEEAGFTPGTIRRPEPGGAGSE